MASLPRPSLIFILLISCLAASSCGVFKSKKDKETPEAERKPLFIGTVEMVNPEQGFVLVRTASRMTIGTGARLETQPGTGSKAILQVTPEKKFSFISADILEGFPKRGDVVFLPYIAPLPGTTTGTPPSIPAPGQPASPDVPAPTGQLLPPSDANPEPGVPPSMAPTSVGADADSLPLPIQ